MKKRKPVHKMLAFLLSVTMLPVVFPLKNAQAAAGTLMTVDFEDYEVGVICEATDSTGTVETTFGDNIYYKLFPGDKLEIAEEDGNKYLRFTRVSSESANSYVMYWYKWRKSLVD